MNLKTLGDFKKDGKRWVIQIRMRTRRKRQLPIQEGKAAAWQSSIQMLQASCQKLKKTQSKTQNILEHPNNSLKIQKAKIKALPKSLSTKMDSPLMMDSSKVMTTQRISSS